MIKSVKIVASMKNKRPASLSRAGTTKTKVKHLSVHEVRKFFRAIPAENLRDRLLFHLIYRYALRRSEAARICLKDFDLKAGLFLVHRLKGGESHQYPLFPDTKRLLRRYLDKPRALWTAHLFPSRQRLGEPISASLVALRFREYAHAADLPPDRRHVHVLRHSFGMHMQEGELDGLDMKDWMGHVSWASTQVYIGVSDRRRLKSMKKLIESGEIA
jgi:integrase/recombinase XerC/integrase/recombinase XerD